MSGEATSPEIKATGPAGGGTGGAGAGAGGTAAGASGAAAAAGSTYRRDRHAALRVDVHTHILPETWPDLKARYGYGGFIYLDHHKPHCAKMMRDDGHFFREIEDNCWSPKRIISDCDATGVDVHVLSTVPVMFSYWAKPEDTLDVSRIINDNIHETVNTNPERFVGLGTVPMNDPVAAVDELTRCVTELGMQGIEIGTHVGDKTLDHESLFPIFKRAEKLGAAVFIHPWDMIGSDLMSKYWLPWLVSMPAETSMAICSVMFSGMLEKLPDLRLCFAHGGGSFPGTVGRVQHGFDVRPDLCATDTSLPPREWGGKFWSDSLVHDRDMLDLIVKVFGEDKVCLGTDYPFPLGEYSAESGGKEYVPGRLIDSMDHWTPERSSKVLGLNACEWLNVEPERFMRK